MTEVTIAFYSTFSGKGWKGEQLNEVVDTLEANYVTVYGYGLVPFSQRKYNSSKNLRLTFLPLLFSYLCTKFLNLIKYKTYFSYLLGEYIFGLYYKGNIKRSSPKILFCKPRPHAIVESVKDDHCLVVVEYGECHPLFTYEKVVADYNEFGMQGQESIYTNKYACLGGLKSIDLADRIIVLSEASLLSFMQYGVERSKLVRAPLSLEKKANMDPNIDNFFETRSSQFAFVCVAEHSFVKGTHRLLLAWQKANITSFPLVLVGNLSDDIVEFIERYGPFDNVVFLGLSDISDVFSRYHGVGVLVSHAEGMGRVVLEYMMFGLCVLVTPVATCDVVEHGFHGIVTDNSIESLRRAIVSLASDPQAACQMGRNCYETMLTHVSPRYSENLLQTLKNL